jgi:hypothetical protein
MVLLYLAAFIVVCLGVVALRRRPESALMLYRVALLLAALPYLLHVRYTWGWVSGFGDPQARIGVYPGLVAFAATALITVLGLLTSAWIVLPHLPIATVALPGALWLVYWCGSIRLAYWRAPDFIPIDNRPLAWLFGVSAVATVLLAACLWVVRGTVGIRSEENR